MSPQQKAKNKALFPSVLFKGVEQQDDELGFDTKSATISGRLAFTAWLPSPCLPWCFWVLWQSTQSLSLTARAVYLDGKVKGEALNSVWSWYRKETCIEFEPWRRQLPVAGRFWVPCQSWTYFLLPLAYQPPAYQVPDEIDFRKTTTIGYPSGDRFFPNGGAHRVAGKRRMGLWASWRLKPRIH